MLEIDEDGLGQRKYLLNGGVLEAGRIDGGLIACCSKSCNWMVGMVIKELNWMRLVLKAIIAKKEILGVVIM